MRPRSSAASVAVALVLCAAASLAASATGLAATLVGGSEQRAIEHAFDAQTGHRDQLIISVRASTVAPAWAVVRSVTPEAAGRSGGHAASVRLHSTYYHRVGAAERPGDPPQAARSDLDRNFNVAVVYTGSGGESISYDGVYRSNCAGDGDLTDDQTVTVDPMSWSVRYVVDLDDLLSVVRSSDGAVLVPDVSFDPAGSHLDAAEQITRTVVDAGCNGRPLTLHCTTSFGLGGPAPGGALSFMASSGLQVGLPMTAGASGACLPADYTLGPSLWDSGAATAAVAGLGLVGGSLPADPYAPVRVSWPGGSAQQSAGFAVSPCQGDGIACSDDFHWTGTVAIRPLP